MNQPLNVSDAFVVRGFIPDGLRSSPNTRHPDYPGTPRVQDLRLLRSRSGINPLATGNCIATGNLGVPLYRIATRIRRNTAPVGAAKGCDLLILLFSGIEKSQSKRSTSGPRATIKAVPIEGSTRF
ncbi:hypothetical protein JFT86_23240 [Pseudomonas sp. TH06]|uniref:hypothetical protein n=1 Tax=Pseudomonas sp. TH06 TaxID=2796372 RepID=UPI001911CF2B|nr:hypothetical protein [Pseudomonas sp. TH06]MBK5529856.1 hypothetical protein [Pseudomonas sp. TH06]